MLFPRSLSKSRTAEGASCTDGKPEKNNDKGLMHFSLSVITYPRLQRRWFLVGMIDGGVKVGLDSVGHQIGAAVIARKDELEITIQIEIA